MEVEVLKAKPDKAFTCKELGDMRYFLGIVVSSTDKGIMLN